MATDGGGRNTESPRFHGRRKGPSLSPRKKSILAVTYPRLGLSRPEQRPGGLDPVALFDVRPERFELEIGFGKGEHLVRRAAACPDTGFIGCEPYVNGLVAWPRPASPMCASMTTTRGIFWTRCPMHPWIMSI